MSFHNKVVYQIYPKSFQDSNGDGWGDIRGVIDRLDYLADLGIDVIWFNPMTVSPQKDNGYDVTDYRRFDPRYGTMEDFEELVKETKKRHIDIMFDMVFNHTSTTHEWFRKALAGDAKYQDYYIFREGKADGSAPNNWQSKFGGPAWVYVPSLKKWYLHLFDPTQADLNWANPAVRQECADIVNFWRSKGVKGFRFDVINEINKWSFEDDPNNFDGRQFYTDGPREEEYLKFLNENSFGQDPDHITVGEMSSTTIEKCAKYAGKDSHELDMVFSFHHLKVDYKDGKKWELQPFDFMELKKLLFSWQLGMQEQNAWNALFWNCHDQPRSVSRFGDDKKYRRESAKMLATAIHLLRGTPYVYQGEEIGMTNAGFTDIAQYRDVESINFHDILLKEGKPEEEILHILNERSRDNARTPMQWNDMENAGFTEGTPWLPVCSNYKAINAVSDRWDPDSIFNYYRELIRLRHSMEIVAEGEVKPLLEEHPDVFAYERTYSKESMIVVCNFFGRDTDVKLDVNGYELLLSNYRDSKPSSEMHLRPYESLVLYRK